MKSNIIQKEKISIIIPVYNSEQFIDKCLNSIINQTYNNIEIICINDGSTDNSLNILKQYKKKDNRIKIINKKNSGVSAARNDGIEISTGEYITFVDSDDWLEQNAIELLYNTIKEKRVDVVRGNYCINYDLKNTKNLKKGNLYNLSNQKLHTNAPNFDTIVIDKLLNGQMQCYIWLLLIKKEKINNIHFKEDINFMEDTIFYQELMNKVDSIYFLDKPLYHYYCNPNSCTQSNEYYIRNMYNLIKVNKYLKEIITNGKFYSKKRIEKLNSTHLYLILNYFYYIYHFTNKNKKELINDINEILNNKDIQELIKISNLKQLPLYLRIFVILAIKKKYKLLFILYDIRKILIDIIN